MTSTRKNVSWGGKRGWEWRDENSRLHREDGPAVKAGVGRYEWALYDLVMYEVEHGRLMALPAHLRERVVGEMSDATSAFLSTVDDENSPEADAGLTAVRNAILDTYEAAVL